MSPANYWKLGLFIVVCLALGLATLAFIGAQKFDREVSVVHYFFNEPVDGLSVGSQIRLRGIPIGAVTAIGLADDLIHVQVEGEIDVATLERLGLKEPGIDLEADVMRERLREKGLRAFLERNMLTGVSLINSDYFEEFRGTFPEYPFEIPMRTIPTMPSTFKGIMADLEATLSWLREELPGTVDRVQHLIIELDHAIVELDTGRISSDLKELLRELRGQTGSLAASMDGALTDGRELMSRLAKRDGPVDRLFATYEGLGEEMRTAMAGLDLGETQAALDRTLAAIGGAGDGVVQLTDQLSTDLARLGQTLESAQRLAEVLERDPSALLRGRGASRSPIERMEP